MIQLALIDDQELIRQALKSLLTLSGKVHIVLEGGDGSVLLESDLSGVDVVVMDIRMPNIDGLTALRTLRQQGNPLPVLMLTTFHDQTLFEQAVAAGAQGFMRKDTSPDMLLEAIETLHQGGSMLNPSSHAALSDFQYDAGVHQADELNDKERNILRLMAGGYSNREIAGMVHLAEGTVKNYVSEILLKLHARDRTQAVLKAITLKLI